MLSSDTDAGGVVSIAKAILGGFKLVSGPPIKAEPSRFNR